MVATVHPKLDRVKAWHTIIEAQRLAFADRDRFIGDPNGRTTAAAEPVRRGGGSAMTVKR
ncbi:hypothetical protein C7B77_09580 [Chamaesiphon polymorphus CCALA 037]|uniref:Uncharacterized protein n=1 Tax=Chamaesiphon polymorphus CCALA 037 TaxID=2107692 RepID=A0A2T1GHE2_9CYAN|nr:hypothetical protein C7B77_09580 [Chamaesiphon polymorphus CCALA 037]